MDMTELKTVLTDMFSNLQMVIQALEAGEAPAPELTEPLNESFTKAFALLAKADEEPKPDDEKKKPEETEMAKTLKNIESMLKGHPVAKSAEPAKINKDVADRLELIEKGFSELLAGYGIKDEPAPVQKGLQGTVDQGAFLEMFAGLVAKSLDGGSETSGGKFGESPIRKNREKLGQFAKVLQAQTKAGR